MGFLSRLFRPPLSELRYRGDRYSDGWGASTLLGSGRAPMAPHLAEQLSSVSGCVELIAGAVASLPASLTIDGPDGQRPAPNGASAWALLARPNPRQSWPAFCTSLTASVLLCGNSVAAKLRDGRGAVVGLVPIPWPWLAVQVVQSAGGPRLVYDVVPTTPEASLLGLPRRLLDSDVLHLRARSDETVIGRSVLARAAGVVAEAADLATAGAATWRNGMRPSGVLQLPAGKKLGDVAFERLKIDLAASYGGVANTGRTPVLEDGAEFKQTALSSVDAEFLASRQFSVAEVARLFGVPLGLLQPGQGVQPYAEMVAAFATLALAPIVAGLEAEFAEAVLPPGMYLQLDMGGLMRGSFSGQVAAFGVAVQSGFMSPNDARRGLGLPPHPNGDGLRPGNAPNWPADALGVPAMVPRPGHTGDGLPAVGTNENQGAG